VAVRSSEAYFNTPMKQTENSDQMPGLPRLAYNIREVADILGVSTVTVCRWIKSGLLKCSWASRHKLIPLAEIERFLRDTLE
jgi:excisionase family DNA binding protein